MVSILTPPGELITADYQVELNGLLMGEGTNYRLIDFAPFTAPEIRTNDYPLPLNHGVVTGADLYGGRTIEFEILITTTAALLDSAIYNLLNAFRSNNTIMNLAFRLSGTKYIYTGKPRDVEVVNTRYGKGQAQVMARFMATDPRRYGYSAQSVQTGFPTASGGLTFAAPAPFVFGVAGEGGTMTATNNGTFPAPWSAVVTGPVVNPKIEHVEQGKYLELVGTFVAGDYLVFNSSNLSILLNGSSSRYSLLRSGSSWFNLSPGANTIRLGGSSGSGDLSLSWRSAWY